MSVDVFGHPLNKNTPAGSRGPPGVGFKFTDDGHYDLENKRLCNLGDPLQPADAISMKIVKSIVEQEIRLWTNVSSSLGARIDENKIIIQALEVDLKKNLMKQQTEQTAIQNQIKRNSKLISRLDTRLNVLEQAHIDDKNRLMIESLESGVNVVIKRLEGNIKSVQDLTVRNSETISKLSETVNKLKHE